jgi:hypothetical protein
MNGLHQSNVGHAFMTQQKERIETTDPRAKLNDVFDRMLTKGGQLQAVLALMTQTATDDEIVPVYRLAVCQIAFDLATEMLSAVTVALDAVA